jgi:hypothetical protein
MTDSRVIIHIKTEAGMVILSQPLLLKDSETVAANATRAEYMIILNVSLSFLKTINNTNVSI